MSAGRGGGVVCVNFFSLVGILFFFPEPGKGKFTLNPLSDLKDVTSGLLVLLMGST